MQRRDFLKFAGLATGFSLSSCVKPGETARVRPNIVLVIADDMAWDDCGAYGHKDIRTPNIDRLANEGMRFDRAFLTCSSCSPSRCSILTGRYPHATGAGELHSSQFLVMEPSYISQALSLAKENWSG